MKLLRLSKKIIKTLVPYWMLWVYRRFLLNYRNLNETRELLQFDIHLTDHCNLKCAGCEHFSPLAEEKFMDITVFEKDCSQLNKLTGGVIKYLGILGGEPLLHPLVNNFMEISRKYFPSGQIAIVTNGILLEKQTDTFWKTCKENDIDIILSVYPVKINHFEIKERADSYGVKIIWWGDPLNVTKDWRKLKIDLKGSQNPILSNNLCYASNTCFQLVDGRLYKCWRIAYIKYFNKQFNQNLEVTEDDYIDIYKAKNVKEILERIRKPFKFCRYCDMKNPEPVKWKISKKEISEWI